MSDAIIPNVANFSRANLKSLEMFLAVAFPPVSFGKNFQREMVQPQADPLLENALD